MVQDSHWSLYTRHCSTCLVTFSSLVHIEDREEVERLLSQTGLVNPGEIEREVSRIYNPTMGGRTDATQLSRYVGQLSCGEVMGLYQRYRADFVMFQYSVNHILDMADGGKGC